MPSPTTPQQFIAKWKRVALSERSASQQHFLDLCDLLDQQKPAEADPDGAWYTFERGVRKTGGGGGWADVWMRGHFAWEYKGKHKDLKAAYDQLLLYREDLENPPLLIVCDMNRFEVHTNFTDTVKNIHAFNLDGLANPANLDVLRKVFTDPHSLRPFQTDIGITENAAVEFGKLADALRGRKIAADRAAHFLMKIVFCLFAEDIELLPKDLFTTLLKKGKTDPQRLTRLLIDLFTAMSKGGDFGADTIAYFNGGLFADTDVVDLRSHEIETLQDLGERYNWAYVEPSIFGTLFERSLDPDKRAQIGAHYTSKDDILTLVEPVLMAPLRREWAQVRARCDELWPKIQAAARAQRAPGRGGKITDPKERKTHDKLIQDFVERIAHVRVLDPACGSGNFLYVAIQRLLDLEKEVIAFAADRALALIPHVRPTQLAGIEINPYAQELAQVVIWIGYLQWMKQNGFVPPSNPVLEPIQSIRRMDAVVDLSNPDKPAEPDWPDADVIIGNPPFLGGKLLRTNLGDDYIDAMFKVWNARVPREADLCCYWFEKARQTIHSAAAKSAGAAQIRAAPVRKRRATSPDAKTPDDSESLPNADSKAHGKPAVGSSVRAGLLATQGIRGGANREVVKRIKETGDIFFAVSDRDWILDGANVHVSMIGFDDGTDSERKLDGATVPKVNADLTSESDLTSASPLRDNLNIGYMGDTKVGPFEIDAATANEWLKAPNPTNKSNSRVVRPWVNTLDITRRPRELWIVDFPPGMSEGEAACFELPFEYIKQKVRPFRAEARSGDRTGVKWWIHQRPRPDMRAAIESLPRFAATPTVAKFRVFVWLASPTLPDHQLIAFARDDDYFFGVLHSAIHERWSLRMGTALEDRPRYTPTTCFETFPFPPLSGGIAKTPPLPLGEGRGEGQSPLPVGEGQGEGFSRSQSLRHRIAAPAQKLNELRENWLNPKTAEGAPALSDATLKKRTLTSLYNDRPTWLELAHLDLDRAVLAAYGLPEDWAEKLQPQRDANGKVNPILGVANPAVEQELLSRLLTLNLSTTSNQSA